MDHNYWISRGFFWNEKEKCYEKPITKTQRNGSNILLLPESAGDIVQEQAESRQKRKAVRTKRGGASAPGTAPAVERTILINFKIPNFKTRDIDGMLVSLLDQLVHAGIIPDDSVLHIQREFVGFTISEVPGVEIILIEYHD